MKNIIQFNPDTNIESHSIQKNDIILVYKDDEPIGYVHNTDGKYKLYANFFNLENIVETNVIEELNSDGFILLEDLIKYYPELQFKLVE